jgi:quercetin dioxygenase-like cupin family protein
MKHSDGGDRITADAALYALGALTADEAKAFEAHLASGCIECANEVEPARLVVEALGMAGPEIDPPAGVRARLLSQLAPPPASPDAHAEDFVTVRAGEGQWHQLFEGVSVKQLFVDEERNTVTSLFRVSPGAGFPPHIHDEFEQCLIVEGDFHLNGEAFGAGDFTCAMAGSAHEHSYSENGALLLIVAGMGHQMSHQPVA